MSTGSRAVTWTVVSWNLHGAAGPDLDAVAAALGALGADVVALQEVRRPQAATLAAALGANHVWALKHTPFPWLPRSRAEGLAVLSPHRVRDLGIEVISASRRTTNWRRRILLEVLVERADHSGYRVVDTHLSPHGDQAPQRLAEAAKVAARAARTTAPAAIVAGDLNDAGEPGVVTALEAAGLRDAWTAAGPGPDGPAVAAFTNPAALPTQTLDHVLVPAAATDVTVDVPPGTWASWSDHLPVRATFTLPWAAPDLL